jgi:endoglucanase
LETKKFLMSICDASGVAGYEAEAAGLIKDAFAELGCEVSIDKLGNVCAVKKGKGRFKIAFFSHMDEIGLVVKTIEKNGFVRFTQIGGYDQRTLLAQEVIIHGKERVYGVIGIKPPHLIGPDEAKKSVKMSDMLIDTGYSEERLKELVKVGDIITIKRRMIELKNEVLAGKALDDRACVAAMFECAKNLKDFNHDADLYFVSTAQEEVGTRGAIVATYGIEPDIGVVLDVGFAKTPELKPHQTCEFGKGPVVEMGPNIHPKVCELLKAAAKDNNIPMQIGVSTSGQSGTDARVVQISREGVATGLLGLPLKYMHTSVECVMMKDVVNTGKLLSAFVIGQNGKDLEESLCL